MNDLKDTYQELLDMYCSKDSSHEVLRQPFFDGNDVCAGNVYTIIRICPEACGLFLPQTPPKRVEVSYRRSYPVSVSQLAEAISCCDTMEEMVEVSAAVKCDECGGSGTVMCEYKAKSTDLYKLECDCPVCNGFGDIKEAEYSPTGRLLPCMGERISINGVMFDAMWIFQLVEVCHKLGVSKLTVTSLQKTRPCAFRINDSCEVVIMPLGKNCGESKHDIKIKS